VFAFKAERVREKNISYFAEVNILLQPTMALINTAAAKTVTVYFTVTS
jgi:hypothetical protein